MALPLPGQIKPAIGSSLFPLHWAENNPALPGLGGKKIPVTEWHQIPTLSQYPKPKLWTRARRAQKRRGQAYSGLHHQQGTERHKELHSLSTASTIKTHHPGKGSATSCSLLAWVVTTCSDQQVSEALTVNWRESRLRNLTLPEGQRLKRTKTNLGEAVNGNYFSEHPTMHIKSVR